MQIKLLHNKHFWAVIFATLYVVFALLTYKDFGATADEEVEYKASKALMQYVLTGNTPKNPGIDDRHLPENATYFRMHTAFYTLLNSANYYEWFHLLNMFAFLPLLLLIFYIFATEFGIFYGVVSFLALFFTPRLMGDVPTNSKDIPFAVVYFFGLAFIYFEDKRDLLKVFIRHVWVKYLILGAIFGVAIATRQVGLTLLMVFILKVLPHRFEKVQLVAFFKKSLIVTFVAFFVLWLTLPYFRVNFPKSFFTIYQQATDFSFWNDTKLFKGEFLTRYQRPLTYLPVWIAISTPVFQLLGLLLSAILVVKVKKLTFPAVLWLTLIINFILYAVLRPNIYNAWRHFAYLGPTILVLALYGIFEIRSLQTSKQLKQLVLVMCLLFAIKPIYDFVSLHPYQYVYFNEFAGGLTGAHGIFEGDYWGATYKEISEWVRDNPTFSGSKVYSCNVSYAVQYYAQGKFTVVQTVQEASVVMCDYDEFVKRGFTPREILYTVKRQGVDLNYVFTL